MQLHCLAKLNSVQLTGSRTGNDKVTNGRTAPKTVGMRQSTTAKHTQDEEKQSERDELAESPSEKTKSVKTLVDIAKLEEDTEGSTAMELTEREHLTIGMFGDNHMEPGLGDSLRRDHIY